MNFTAVLGPKNLSTFLNIRRSLETVSDELLASFQSK